MRSYGYAIGALFLLFLLGYGRYLYVLAKESITNSPRAPMYVCDKHGPIADKYVLKLEGYTEDPLQYCPICFHEKTHAKQ